MSNATSIAFDLGVFSADLSSYDTETSYTPSSYDTVTSYTPSSCDSDYSCSPDSYWDEVSCEPEIYDPDELDSYSEEESILSVELWSEELWSKDKPLDLVLSKDYSNFNFIFDLIKLFLNLTSSPFNL